MYINLFNIALFYLILIIFIALHEFPYNKMCRSALKLFIFKRLLYFYLSCTFDFKKIVWQFKFPHIILIFFLLSFVCNVVAWRDGIYQSQSYLWLKRLVTIFLNTSCNCERKRMRHFLGGRDINLHILYCQQFSLGQSTMMYVRNTSYKFCCDRAQ